MATRITGLDVRDFATYPASPLCSFPSTTSANIFYSVMSGSVVYKCTISTITFTTVWSNPDAAMQNVFNGGALAPDGSGFWFLATKTGEKRAYFFNYATETVTQSVLLVADAATAAPYNAVGGATTAPARMDPALPNLLILTSNFTSHPSNYAVNLTTGVVSIHDYNGTIYPIYQSDSVALCMDNPTTNGAGPAVLCRVGRKQGSFREIVAFNNFAAGYSGPVFANWPTTIPAGGLSDVVSGLGIAAVYDICGDPDGRIYLSSEGDGGSGYRKAIYCLELANDRFYRIAGMLSGTKAEILMFHPLANAVIATGVYHVVTYK